MNQSLVFMVKLTMSVGRERKKQSHEEGEGNEGKKNHKEAMRHKTKSKS
jgi:hypothetical protein